MRTLGFLASLVLIVGCSDQQVSQSYTWNIPEGFPKPEVPIDNPMSEAKVELGRHLFYDNNLSGNQSQSCSSCHIQALAFSENKDVSIGSTGERIRRNSPALVNIAYNKTLTWAHDGLTAIEMQLLLPMFGEEPVELGITGREEEVLARFDTPLYRRLTDDAFPGENLNFDLMVKALSSFVRSLISMNTPFDRYAYQADDNALNASQLRGLNLFFSEKLECHHCHGGFNFTQSTSHEKQPLDRRPFHNTALYNIDGKGGYPEIDIGLAEVSGDPKDIGRFRAPTLRNIALSAPYMHDGSVQTLEDVIEIYANGGRNIVAGGYAGDGRLSPLKSQFVSELPMTEQDKKDVLAFLHSLTDEAFISNPAFSNPFE